MVDRVMRWEKGSATDALREFNARRAALPVKERVAPLSKSSVHRYANGQTHSLWKPEGRGGKRKISNLDIPRLNQARRRLIKQADGEHRVTYAMIIDEAKEKNALECDPCQRVVEDALRGVGVCYRKPRQKIQLSGDDAKTRHGRSKEWVKKRKSFWSEKVHAYLDCKDWPLPLSPKQRKRFKQTRVSGNLRKCGEGIDRGFTQPRQKPA